MPSTLVLDVRDRLAAHPGPLTAVDRTLLLASITSRAHRDEHARTTQLRDADEARAARAADRDPLDRLEAAIAGAQRALRSSPTLGVDPGPVRALLAAARAVLDDGAATAPSAAAAVRVPVPAGPRPAWRADLDG